ncbi:MAG: DegT/DnrJ/EryC1/StrS family aminotransferase, partial [Solirubrobacteraceae bacterium]
MLDDAVFPDLLLCRAMRVPLFDNATPLDPLRDTILSRIAEVAADGRFILGPNVDAFEQEFAAYLGA